MRVLVTGATGFVGEAVARRLLAEGHEVCALVRDRERARPLEERGVQLCEGELGDPASIARAAAGCEVAVHAAGESSHRASPRALGWINVAGTENVVRGARHGGVRRLVHVSCVDATITPGPRVGWDEDRLPVQGPFTAFGRSKLQAEELVVGAGGRGSATPFETLVLRAGQVWGPGDLSSLPVLAREALEGGLALCGRGDNLVATTYVGNLVAAILRALDAPDAAGAVIHVTDAEMTLAREFYGELCAALGAPPPRRSVLGFRAELARARLRRRLGRPGPWPTDAVRRGQSSAFDQSRARALLGFEPPVSQREGFAALRAWVVERGGARAIAAAAREPATDASVAAQIRLAEEG